MNQAFDAYQAWLGIPPAEQPPNHYRLLGVKSFEPNLEAIAGAATNLINRIRGYQQPPHQLAAYHLLGEIEKARSVLLDPAQRAQYDAALRTQSVPRTADAWPPGMARPALQPQPAPLDPAPISPAPAAVRSVAVAEPAVSGFPALELDRLPQARSLVAHATPVAPTVAAPVRIVAMPPSQPIAAQQPPSPPKASAPVHSASAQPASPMLPVIKIVAGGIGGLALGAVVVYLITGESFGLLAGDPPKPKPVVQAPVARPAKPQPVAKPYTPPPLVPPSAPGFPASAVTPPENSPGITPTAAPPVETPPETPPPAPPGTGNPPAGNPTPPVAASPAAPAPPSSRRQPPTPAEQQKMLAELQGIYKSDFERGTKPDGRVEFVAFLCKTARELKTEPVAQFVLWRQAYDAAIGQNDFVTAADAIDELEVVFEVDGFRLRQHLLTQASQAAKRPEDRAPLIPFALDLADYAVRAQKMEELTKLANIAESLARTADKDTRSQVAAKTGDMRRAASDFSQVALARAKLAQEPANAAAALIDGRFRCFVAGQWKAGLPLLAQSDHAALSAAAKQDLAGPTDSVKASQLGDAWFDLAAADPAMAGAYHRAAHWYREAATAAQGLEKAKIDKRLEQIALVNLPPQSADETAPAPALPTARALLTRAKTFERSDLLAAMTPETMRTQGWSVNPGYVRVVSTAEYARLQSPIGPAGEYQTVLRVRRTSSSPSRAGIFVVGLPHRGSQFLVVLDHPIPGRGTASFLTLSGLKRPEDNPTLKLQAGQSQLLQYGREQTLHCSVAMNEIKITLDGQPVIEYRGDMSKLSVPREWAVPDPRSLFLGSHQGSFSIDAWLLGPLRDEGGKELPLSLPPSGIPPFMPPPPNLQQP